MSSFFFLDTPQVLGVSAAVLMLLWESKSVTIGSLNSGTTNYRNELNGFVGISLLTVLYSIGMASLGLSGLNLPPFLVNFLAHYEIYTTILLLNNIIILSKFLFPLSLLIASFVRWSDVVDVGVWSTNYECKCNSTKQQLFR